MCNKSWRSIRAACLTGNSKKLCWRRKAVTIATVLIEFIVTSGAMMIKQLINYVGINRMSNNSSNTCIIKNKSIASLNETYKLIIRGGYEMKFAEKLKSIRKQAGIPDVYEQKRYDTTDAENIIELNGIKSELIICACHKEA